MLNFLYEVFITPIIWLMSFLFEYLPKEGFVIILLSICVNILLIPIYRIFLGWQEEDTQKQLAMKDKLQMIQQSFVGQLRFMMIRTLYKQNHYHQIYPLRNSLGFLVQIPFFVAAYIYIGSNEDLVGASFLFINDLSKPDAALPLSETLRINILPIAMTVISIASAWQYTKGGTIAQKIQLFTLPLIFLVLLYKAPSALVLYWTTNVTFAFVGSLMRADALNKDKINKRKDYAVIFSSLAVIIVIATLYFPIKLIISDDSFGSDITLLALCVFSLQLFLLLGFAIYTLSCINLLFRFMRVLLPMLALFALLSTVYNFLDTGALRGFEILNINALGKMIKQRLFFDILILTALYFIIRFIIRKHLLNVMLLSSLGVIIFSAYSYYDYKNSLLAPATLLGSGEPDYIHNFASFSKDQQNIVVIVLDTFNNQHIEVLREMMPRFDELFDGFTWYSNSVSRGNYTVLGAPAIYGGHNYAPYEINQRSNEVDTLVDELAKGFTVFVDNFSKKGFDVQLGALITASCERVNKHTSPNMCIGYHQMLKDFQAYYLNAHPLLGFDLKGINSVATLSVIGLYNIVPYSLRKRVYDNGSWLGLVGSSEDAPVDVTYLGRYGFLEAFVEFSNTKSSRPTFKFVHDFYAHQPWQHEIGSCLVTKTNLTSDVKRLNGIPQDQIQNEYCALKLLAGWIQWLKKEGIFDNTMIVLVSDHEGGGNARLTQSFGGDITQPNNENEYPGHPSSLLMVKDFNSRQEFQESKILMSNGDVPAIVCAQIGGCKEIEEEDPRVNPVQNRSIIHSIGSWVIQRHEKNRFILESSYKVTNDMYDPRNWQKIEVDE